jgi:hypothetical protein
VLNSVIVLSCCPITANAEQCRDANQAACTVHPAAIGCLDTGRRVFFNNGVPPQ